MVRDLVLQALLYLTFHPNPDTGASKLIAERKIKLKSDSAISSFTENTIKFENGTELPADVVVFATGWAMAD